MSIWFAPPDLAQLNHIHHGTAVSALGIEITAVGEDSLSGTMPVDQRTKQPWGLLHGGASVLLAETLGSAASMCCVDQTKWLCVGLEVNANHIRGVRDGRVTGVARPIISDAPRTSGGSRSGPTTSGWCVSPGSRPRSFRRGPSHRVSDERSSWCDELRLRLRCRSHRSLESADERSASSQASWTRRALAVEPRAAVLAGAVGRWTSWAFASAIGWVYWMDNPDRPHVIALYTFAALVGMLFSSLLRYAYRALWTRSLTLRIVTAAVLSYVMGGLWQATKNLAVAYIFDEFEPMGWLGYFEGIQASFYVMLLWSGFYFGIKYYQMLQRETEKVLRVTAMAHEAQLKMLRYQLNPHFLFNTLNAISTLILERNTDNANQMVTRLSRFLRYSLDNDPMQRVSFDQELAALQLYLDIEQVRFDERLKVETNVEALARRALIPSLLLQPIVENAIKYAIAPRERGGMIRIDALVRGAQLQVEITDDGPGLTEPVANGSHSAAQTTRGVGLVNTRQRLHEIYPHEHSFTMTNVIPQGLQVCVRIPFETS